VHDDANVRVAARFARGLEALAQLVQRVGALLVVRRVHVDVQDLRAGLLKIGLELGDVLEARPEVEMDAADVVAGGRERPRSRLAHAR